MNLFLKISTRSFLILLHVLRTHYSKQFSLAKLKFRVFSKWPRKASFPLILKKLSNFIHFKAQIRREYTWNRNHALHRITYLYIKNGISFGLSKKQVIVLDSITPAYFFSWLTWMQLLLCTDWIKMCSTCTVSDWLTDGLMDREIDGPKDWWMDWQSD